MNQIIILILIGFGSGIVIFPIGLWIFNIFRNTKERRRIKRMIKKGQFLIPIDEKDFNTKAWTNQKYGNIDLEEGKKDLERLNEKIFKKKIDKTKESKSDFINQVVNYITEARKLGYSDDQIIDEFKKKNYNDEVINEVFEYAKM